jgi:hypothetical protein
MDIFWISDIEPLSWMIAGIQAIQNGFFLIW